MILDNLEEAILTKDSKRIIFKNKQGRQLIDAIENFEHLGDSSKKNIEDARESGDEQKLDMAIINAEVFQIHSKNSNNMSDRSKTYSI